MSDFFVPDDDLPPPGRNRAADPLGWRGADVALETYTRQRRDNCVTVWKLDPRRCCRGAGRRRGGAAIFRPDRAIRVATGFVAHNLCVKTFISGLDPQVAFAEANGRAGFRRLRYLLGYRLDATAKTVEASALGYSAAARRFMKARAASNFMDRSSPICCGAICRR